MGTRLCLKTHFGGSLGATGGLSASANTQNFRFLHWRLARQWRLIRVFRQSLVDRLEKIVG